MLKYQYHQHRNSIEKQNPNLLINLAWMSTDWCRNMYTCAKISPNCQTSMNKSGWRTKDWKTWRVFALVSLVLLLVFDRNVNRFEFEIYVIVPILKQEDFFYVLKFTFDRPLGSDDLIHIFNPNSENISLTSGILKMFFKYSLALFYWAMNYVSH